MFQRIMLFHVHTYCISYSTKINVKCLRLEDLDSLARKIELACENNSSVVDSLEEEVKDLEQKSTGMDPSNASKLARDLSDEIKVREEGGGRREGGGERRREGRSDGGMLFQEVLATVEDLEVGVKKLKEGEHPDADAIGKRYNGEIPFN